MAGSDCIQVCQIRRYMSFMEHKAHQGRILAICPMDEALSAQPKAPRCPSAKPSNIDPSEGMYTASVDNSIEFWTLGDGPGGSMMRSKTLTEKHSEISAFLSVINFDENLLLTGHDNGSGPRTCAPLLRLSSVWRRARGRGMLKGSPLSRHSPLHPKRQSSISPTPANRLYNHHNGVLPCTAATAFLASSCTAHSSSDSLGGR